MSDVKVFRKKPVEVEAIRLDAEGPGIGPLDANAVSHARIAGWMFAHNFRDFHVVGASAPFGLLIKTSEGNMLAKPGDWIIRGTEGEFYPCKPDAFESTFEATS